jgi:cardiolipin synthase A/B
MVPRPLPHPPTQPFRLTLSFAIAIVAVAVALFFGAGCASVPDTSFLRQGTPAQMAEFKNAWGPIPAKTSAAVMAELKRKSGNLDILDRQIAIEQAVVGKPLVLGNRVTLLQDGPATYEAMLTAIRRAKSTINVETYIIDDGEMGKIFADALLERRAAGVQINLIYDSLGGLKTKKEYFEKLKESGIQVLEFNPINPLAARKKWALNHRDHRKLIVVDGRTAFLGGINIDDVYSRGSASGSHRSGSRAGADRRDENEKDQKRSGWRDTDIQIDGPAVTDLQKLFLQTWEKQKGPPLRAEAYLPAVPPQGKEIVRAIGSSPDDLYSASYLTFIAALINAQKQVYITNAYFVPDPQLVEALLDAAKRGVDVRLILPSTTDSRSAAYAAHSHYKTLLSGGVKIYERRAALLHSKTAVIDGVWSLVGSSNLDWRSAVDNDELNAVILSREFAQRMLEAFALDQAQSDEIDLEQWKHRPFRERAKEWFFRLFARLL